MRALGNAVVAVAIGVCFAGCATKPNPPRSLVDPAQPPVVDYVSGRVCLHPTSAELVETIVLAFGPVWHSPYLTGEIWQMGFRPCQPGAPTIRVERSVLAGEPVALGFATRFTYTAYARVNAGTREVLLRSSADDTSRIEVMDAVSARLIGRVVTDIAAQAELVVSAWESTAPGPKQELR